MSDSETTDPVAEQVGRTDCPMNQSVPQMADFRKCLRIVETLIKQTARSAKDAKAEGHEATGDWLDGVWTGLVMARSTIREHAAKEAQTGEARTPNA